MRQVEETFHLAHARSGYSAYFSNPRSVCSTDGYAGSSGNRLSNTSVNSPFHAAAGTEQLHKNSALFVP